MNVHLFARPATPSLYARRSRAELVDMLVRAHRNQDFGMAESCRAELDRRAQESRLLSRRSAGRS